MAEVFIFPDEYKESFRRLLPYMRPRLRNNPEVFQSLLIYLKIGGERLARIVIDAYNETQRLDDAELRKRLLEEELLRENGDIDENEDGDEDEDEDGDGDDETYDNKQDNV